jgi:ABC-type transporter Mla subunit MlaD
MSDDSFRTDGLADVINLLAAPIASGLRTVEQVKRGVDELFRAVENLNRTMENLNDAAERVNRLLADVEEPVRAMMPQLTRTIRTADEITQRLEGPVKASAPNIELLVTTLSSPSFAALPSQLGEFMNTIGDVSKRLGPLASFAENAGGLFGGFKLPGMSAAPKPPAPTSGDPAPPAAASEQAPPKKAPASKTAAKKTAASKTAAKKTAAKKAAASKTAAKKAAASKTAAKKTAAKRTAGT